MILNKSEEEKKQILLEELAKEDLQVLSLAYAHAKHIHMYDVDITQKISLVTENVEMFEKAYRHGYYDAIHRMREESEENE